MGFPVNMKYYEWFYKVILASANSVPIEPLWLAFLAAPLNLNRALQASMYENGMSNLWPLAGGAIANTAQSGLGALFASSVEIPGDSFGVKRVGPDGSGLIQGLVGTGRAGFEPLKMTFLETNTSFTDCNLRPWMIYASHKSLKDPSVKSTLTVMQLMKTKYKTPLVPRLVWTFHDVCPIQIASEPLNYANTGKIIQRDVTFAYNWYQVTGGVDFVANIGQAVGGVLNSEIDHEHVAIGKNDTSSGGRSQKKSIRSARTAIESHSAGEIVSIDGNDIADIGTDLLTGGGRYASSNVEIPQDDVVNSLLMEMQELKMNQNDSTNGLNIPSELKTPTPEEDHIARKGEDRYQGPEVPMSKASLLDSADTPIFFPGSGGEGTISIQGKQVDEYDRVHNTQIPFKTVPIKKDDTSNTKSINNKHVDILDSDIKPSYQHSEIKDEGDVKVDTQSVSISEKEIKYTNQRVSIPKQGSVGDKVKMQIVKIGETK